MPVEAALFSIEVPDPGATVDDLVSRARALYPLLRQEQQATEERGAPSPEIHEEILKAGLYRVMQPRRFGGYQLPPADFIRIASEIARGCPSTGWYYSFSAGHTQLLAEMFNEQAQIDCFGPDGDFLAPGRLPMGTAKPVDGGWEINGTWDYCSGARYSTHFLPAVMMPAADDPTGPPTQVGTAVIPRSQYTVLDDWGDVLGLRGSSSQSISIEKQVIPEHWVTRYSLMGFDVSVPPPGWEIHKTAHYAGPVQSLIMVEAAAWAIGVARGMLDDYAQMMRDRETTFPPKVPRYQHHSYQRPFGIAFGLVDTAEAASLETARRHLELTSRGLQGGPWFSAEEDIALKMRYQHAVDICWQGVELLFRTGGSRAAKLSNPAQRVYRDFSMARTHLFLQNDSMAEQFSQAYFA